MNHLLAVVVTVTILFAPPAQEPPPEPVFVADEEIPLSAELQEHAYTLCEQNGIPYEVLLALMYTESRFETDLISHNSNGTQDYSICQINSCNADWLLDHYGLDITCPQDNIEAAVVLLCVLLDDYPIRQALAAYQAGRAGMQRGNGYWYADLVLEKAGDYE